jgi:hypothetical protein
MLRCSKLLTLFPTIFLALALACTQTVPGNASNGDSDPTTVPANTEAGAPIASPASMLQSEAVLPTVEVVRRLTPSSVVQVVTETLSVGLFNQPVPVKEWAPV